MADEEVTLDIHNSKLGVTITPVPAEPEEAPETDDE
jgi:hypothetical protein